MPASNSRLTPAQRAVRDVRRAALGRAIRAARRDAGMTQSELAAASTTSRATISRLELGDGAIGSDALWELAAAMGTTPSALYARAEQDDAVVAAEQHPTD
ncbi:XRE family transcriptional regulator [Tsukamurella pulmonis]|nr:helix-turn-helix transcriptional regulator [Tsukamurella pulmonis]RDH12969.1 XRE family transcriptional regulator [Tsukamurella pulmonis]